MAQPWRLPDRPLRDSALQSLIAGFVLVVVASSMARVPLGVSASYPFKAAVVFAAIMTTVLGSLHYGHPFIRFGAANQITTLRAVVVSLIAALLGESLSATATTAIAAAGLAVAALDGVDGRLARRTAMASVFGARFDMETDAFFIMALSALAWQAGKAGPWILLAGLLRYLFVGAMSLLPWMQRQEPASIRRKAICVVQVVGLSAVMHPAIAQPASRWWCAALLALLCYSFGVDTLWLWRHRD